MSKSYAIYEVVTGEIKQVIMTPFEKEVDAILLEGQSYKEIDPALVTDMDRQRLNGNGDIEFFTPAVDPEVAQLEFIKSRNKKLLASDWTQLPDAPVDKEAWAEYRQKLRDLPETTDTLNIVWPDRP